MLQEGVDFDIDVNASVFETNIRGEMGFSVGFVLRFLPVRVSELYNCEVVVSEFRTRKQREKPQTNIASFQSLFASCLNTSRSRRGTFSILV